MTSGQDSGTGPLTSFSTPVPPLPKPPSPSADSGIKPEPDGLDERRGSSVSQDVEIEDLGPVPALRMLCAMIEALVDLTGDVPPTPPVSRPSTPNMVAIQAEKDDIARKSGEVHETGDEAQRKASAVNNPSDPDDVPPRASTPIGSPEARSSEPTFPSQADETPSVPINFQHGILIRKFYSKQPPPISLLDYLLRVHQFCPMSTGVYLASSLFIYRLAVIEKAIPVTSRNAHRLVLAALRVTMKKMEDHRWNHSRFAKVGGISEKELGKLEMSFCFLTNFDLKANKEMLVAHVKIMNDHKALRRAMKGPSTPVSSRATGESPMKRLKSMDTLRIRAPAAA